MGLEVIGSLRRTQNSLPSGSARVTQPLPSGCRKSATWVSPSAGLTEFDFRPGGRERFGFVYQGTEYRYDALYYDIAPEQRIVYAYEMYANGARASVSVATIEFAGDGAGKTTLTWTEQGAYLDGIDGPRGPRLREEGVAEMLGNLPGCLQAGARAGSQR